MANFCCSIESEPKTLNQGQLNRAREVAVDIVQKKEPNEVSSIFAEGQKPVLPIKEKVQTVVKKGELQSRADSKDESGNLDIHKSCQCSCLPANIVEAPDQSKLEEPLSAPF